MDGKNGPKFQFYNYKRQKSFGFHVYGEPYDWNEKIRLYFAICSNLTIYFQLSKFDVCLAVVQLISLFNPYTRKKNKSESYLIMSLKMFIPFSYMLNWLCSKSCMQCLFRVELNGNTLNDGPKYSRCIETPTTSIPFVAMELIASTRCVLLVDSCFSLSSASSFCSFIGVGTFLLMTFTSCIGFLTIILKFKLTNLFTRFLFLFQLFAFQIPLSSVC